jgi:hypothetical protein
MKGTKMENELSTITNDAPEFSRGMYCSIHAETQEDRLDIYEAVSNSLSLDDMVGKVVEVENVIIQPVEMTDNVTGEIMQRNRIVLITPKGDAYGCTSTGVETSMKNLFSIVGCPPWNPAIKFEVVKKQGRNGYKFTSLQRHK